MAEAHHDGELALNEAHRRHLAVSLRHAAELLDDAERILIASRSESPFRKYTSDLAPWQAAVIGDHIAAIRRKLAEAGEEMRLDVAGYAVDARHALRVQTTFAEIDVEKLHSRYLRNYGALDAGTARSLDALANALENAIRELDRALAVPPGESIEARVQRLSRSPVSPEILTSLDHFITKYHIAELRRPMTTLLDRIEQRMFNIAVFGRVSSGKSSLLNALLGAPILPVGVTPITAVPTRVRFGDPASVRIVFADKHHETVSIDQLAEVASETLNPGNRRRVSLLQVCYPSPLLREGVEFVDTPGIGSQATSGAEETFAYLPRADLAIVLVDIGSAIGPDELSVVRLLRNAAIPVQVVISKADLADETSLRQMETYLREVMATQTGLAPVVQPVSAVPAGADLLRRWIEESIQPLLDRHEIMLEDSIRRTTGAIRDAIVMRLGALQNKRPSRKTTATEEKARDIVQALRRWIDELPGSNESAVPDLLSRAADRLFERRDRAWDPPQTIGSTVQQHLDEVRSQLMTRQRETKDRLLEVVARDGVPLELVQLAQNAEQLQHLPLLDIAAALPHIDVRPPMFGGAARLSKLLDRRYGGPLRDTLRSYANRLHDWAIRSLDRTQASFASAIDSTRGGVSSQDLDLTTLGDDLRALADMTTAKEHV